MNAFALPLSPNLDPRQTGLGARLLGLLANHDGITVAPTLVIPRSAVSGPLRADDAVIEQAAAQAWATLGQPRTVVVRLAPVAGANSAPLAADAVIAVSSGGGLLHAVRDRMAHNGSALAALVQPALPALAHGMAYSEDPREDRVDQIHIDAWSGTQPGTTGPAVHYRRARDNNNANDTDSGPITTLADNEAAVALPTATVHALFALLLNAEQAAGVPIALSWRWHADGITVLAVDPLGGPLPWAINRDAPQPHDGWTRANAGEVFPNPVTPMTWSLTAEPLDHGFASLYEDESWTAGRRFVSLHDGYLYFNFGFIYHLNVDRMGAPTRQTTEVVGGPGATEGLRVTDRGMHLATILRNLPLIIRTTRRHERIPDEWEGERARVIAERDQLAALDVASLSDVEILAALVGSEDRLDDFFDFFMVAQGAAFTSFTILSYLLDRFLGDGALANALVQALPGVRTAEGNLALWRLAERASDDPATATLVDAATPESVMQRLRAGADTRWLADALDVFLAEYGHRCAGELEFIEPRWIDDPTPLLRTFREYVRNPSYTNADQLTDRQLRQRLAVERDIDARLGAHWWERVVPIRRRIVHHYMRWAQRYAPLRENPKFYLLAVALEQRRLLIALADRMVTRGVFQDSNDVFFLFKDELSQLVARADDKLLVARLGNRVRRRRLQYDLYTATTPPPVLGALPTESPSTAQAHAPAATDGRRVLYGLGASPGIAEGLARVAANPVEGSALQAGEILVAKFTDPGWTLLFPLAAAVVTDIGGMLSHGAIVAREFGIPAAVNVRTATQEIRTGQRLRVDGDKGTVEIL